MGLISTEVWVGLNPLNIKHYENLGYEIPKISRAWGLTTPKGTKIKVNVFDLTEGSHVLVDVKCDNCGKELKNMNWKTYLRSLREDNKCYCLGCAQKLYGAENTRKTKLKNGLSFEQWCIDNDRQDVLDRWDYVLNKYKPNEVSYSSGIKIYLKCERGIHESELKQISIFTNGKKGSINCRKCKSFAQWGIDHLGEDFLEKYWDYEQNTVDPWIIASQHTKKVWIKCQEKDYHDSYDIKPNDFVGVNVRCPYCSKNGGKVHPLDSLGKLLEDENLLHLWSDKNKRSPYEYAPQSNQYAYFKCPESIHNDVYRKIQSSNKYNFRCPECDYSKGEERISNYFLNLEFIKIRDEDYKILDNLFTEQYKYFVPQKKFDGLIGMGNGLLSYDFYLPNLQYNLLIEYQGKQHDRYLPGFHKSKKDFLTQLEHDKRKREYAQKHNINLLEIWYWDFDNIEKILDEYFNNLFKT